MPKGKKIDCIDCHSSKPTNKQNLLLSISEQKQKQNKTKKMKRESISAIIFVFDPNFPIFNLIDPLKCLSIEEEEKKRYFRILRFSFIIVVR